jgi:hypothetical protein
MGFQLEPNHYKLTFEDPELSGLECTMREVSLAELLDISELLSADPRSGDARERVTNRSEMVASCIVSWNLEDAAGQPVPISGQALLDQPHRFSVAITAAWLREVVGLPTPPARTSESSGDGSSSALERLPMEMSGGPEPI